MKSSVRSISLIACLIGAAIFASAALADTAFGSGYDKLKEAIKTTTSGLEKDLQSYTLDCKVSISDNNQLIGDASFSAKSNNQQKALEKVSIDKSVKTKENYYYNYSDRNIDISSGGDVYRVTEYAESENNPALVSQNPFKFKEAPDIERIVDALVEGVKDVVIIEELPNGGKAYSGSINSAQFPAIINAVASFGVKQMCTNQSDDSPIPLLVGEIYLKNFSGRATTTKEGVLNNLDAELTVCGKDKDNKDHELKINLVGTLKDINSTTVAKPSLEGKKVEKHKTGPVGFIHNMTETNIGTYKSNIVIIRDGKFFKTGERVLNINYVDPEKVTGKYYETYKNGYEPSESVSYSIDTDSQGFKFTNEKGEVFRGNMHPGDNGSVNLQINNNKYYGFRSMYMVLD